jgi:hypothetical protein
MAMRTDPSRQRPVAGSLPSNFSLCNGWLLLKTGADLPRAKYSTGAARLFDENRSVCDNE